jgi:cysteinyl-tRNA synthetase
MSPTLRFHNTATGRVEEFSPIDPPRVHLYTCGPTVHDFAHIGNFRTFLWEDLLRRFLKFSGYQVLQVMNITDVDDKTIRKAIGKGVSLGEYTEQFTEGFFEDARTLRMEPAEVYPRATQHVPEMISLIERLLEKGIAYERDGSVYFRISGFPSYGRLSGAHTRELKNGASVDTDEYQKEDVKDFVLWKAPKEPGEPAWEAPFGRGRPGWHIECSAMSMKYLGESFDIHTGGVDNIFPHHENEIAQSEAATGRPFVRLWMHGAHLKIEGEKMAKSLGNFHTLRELLQQGHSPRVIRHLLLSTHYRKSLNFSADSLHQAAAELERLDDLKFRLAKERVDERENADLEDRIDKTRTEFAAALADDLNISEALASLFKLVRDVNTAFDRGDVGPGNRDRAMALLRDLDRVLGVVEWEQDLPDAEIEAMIQQRQQARSSRDFALADKIRADLAGRGILLEDTPHGVRWKRREPA